MQELAKKIGGIHAKYGIFDKESFEVDELSNIVNDITNLRKLIYLSVFYRGYKSAFQNIGRAPNVSTVSKSVDLPYIGENVIRTGSAKYFIIFEGGTSHPTKLSCTMLACLWPLEQGNLPVDIFGKYWARQGNARYKYAYEKFGISQRVAENSYVIDAVRIANAEGEPDWAENTAVLRKEIALLKPEIVVVAGRKAEQAVKPIREQDQSRQFRYVPYPIWTHEAKGEPEWAKLREALNDCTKFK